jgi:hypothetical protein
MGYQELFERLLRNRVEVIDRDSPIQPALMRLARSIDDGRSLDPDDVEIVCAAAVLFTGEDVSGLLEGEDINIYETETVKHCIDINCNAERFFEPPPEASALEMAVGLVGEINHTQIIQGVDARAVVAAFHLKAMAIVAVAQLNGAGLPLGKAIQSVLHQLLDQMLGRPGGIHCREALGADRQPTLALSGHGAD